MTNPLRPAIPAPPLLPSLATILLVVAGGLAIGGSFGDLEAEAERAGDETLTLTYTAWHLTQGGTYPKPIYFHAPHFGIPLVITGVLAIAGGLLLTLARGRLATFAKPVAIAAASLLVGTVWTVGLVVSADLDAVTHSDDFDLTWSSGAGFWLVLAGGIAATAGGLITVFGKVTAAERAEPPTPPFGVPGIAQADPSPVPHFQQRTPAPPNPGDPA